MVPVRSAAVRIDDLIEALIGSACGRERDGAGRRQVEVTTVDQVHGPASDVRHSKSEGGHLALYREIPLLRVGSLQIRIDSVDVLHRSSTGAQKRRRKAEEGDAVANRVVIRDAS